MVKVPPAPVSSDLDDLVTGRLPMIWTISIVLVVILAGGLFGYDQGVISGALLGIQKEFNLGALALEIVTSWVTLGALFGSLAGGEVADQFGRRWALLSAAALFVAGALIQAFAPNVPILVIGRLLVGFGVGVAAVAAPLYAAELAPAEQRGRFISSYQLAITIGIFLAYLADQALAGAQGWRLMLGLSAAPGLLLLLAVLPAAESPRWFLKVGRIDDARRALAELQPGIDVDARLQSIAAVMRTEVQKNTSWREVFAARWRRPLEVGLGLAVLQQITGINAIIYYSDRIFSAAGFTTAAAQTEATTWAIGGVNLLATFIAIVFIDRLGRRPLLLAGLVGMGVSLAAVGFAFREMPATGSAQGTTMGVVTMAAARRLHHLFCLLAGTGDLDGHQRDLSRRRARAGSGVCDGGQLGRSVPGQRVFPDARQRHRDHSDILALCDLLRAGTGVGLYPSAGDEWPLTRTDRRVLEVRTWTAGNGARE